MSTTAKQDTNRVISFTGNVAGLKAVLDSEGSAYDQVTRERVDNLADDVAELKTAVETIRALSRAILTGVIINLLAFIAALILFILGKVH